VIEKEVVKEEFFYYSTTDIDSDNEEIVPEEN
jgi:hypothetical protein